jgi:hypothetical protein
VVLRQQVKLPEPSNSVSTSFRVQNRKSLNTNSEQPGEPTPSSSARRRQRRGKRKTLTAESWKSWGDIISGKGADTLRIGLQNFGGFTTKFDDPVDESFREWITTELFDIYGVPEVGLYWPKVPAKLQLRERLREWWEPGTSHLVDASNRHAISTRIQRRARQWGGVMQLSKEHAAARVIESGRDPLGLGR